MIDSLKDAIKEYKDFAECETETARVLRNIGNEKDAKYYEETAENDKKIVAWLTELHERRDADRWISVSEKLPNDLEPVNITWINHEPEPYYKEIKGKPFTATGVYFNGQWYWWSTLCTDTLAEYSNNYDDVIDTAIEITHWKPLPKPYKESEDNNG